MHTDQLPGWLWGLGGTYSSLKIDLILYVYVYKRMEISESIVEHTEKWMETLLMLFWAKIDGK